MNRVLTIDPDLLAEAVHTAFRKATDHANAMPIHRMISQLPYDEWGKIVDWIIAAIRQTDVHVMRLLPADKMDTQDPRSFARAVCSCGDYTSSVDSPQSATRAWVQHWLAKTKGIGRLTLADEIREHGDPI